MAESNTKDLVKRSIGRPTKKREIVVKKLEGVFKLGVSDEIACRYAKISKPTFYDWCKKDEDFLYRITTAKDFARLAAGNVVMDAIVKDKDINSAKWWLERKHKDEFGQQMPIVAQQFNIGGKMELEFIGKDEK